MRHRYWRASAFAGLFGLVMSVGLGADLAAAHPRDDVQADAEHAKQDLAATPIEQIEKETRANATKPRRLPKTPPGRKKYNNYKIF